MRIQRIEIRDTLGCSHVVFEPGTVTKISGCNGSGKSSILRALASVFAGGCDSSMIRKGCEKSVVSMTLDNGVRIVKTTYVVKPRRGAEPGPTKYNSTLEITDADDTPIKAPKEFLDDLGQSLSIDPSILLRIDATTAPGRKLLATELMKLVPIAFDSAAVQAACSYPQTEGATRILHPALGEFPDELTLDDLKALSSDIREDRRRAGVVRDECDGTINRLEKSLPPRTEAPAPDALEKLEAERIELERAIVAERAAVDLQAQNAINQAERVRSDAYAAAEKAYRDALAVITQQRSDAQKEADDDLASAKEEIRKAVSEESESIIGRRRPDLDRITAATATVKERLAAQERGKTLRAEIEIQQSNWKTAAWKYDQLSGVLDRLEALRLDKLRSLPVDGLVVEGGEAYIDGIPWDKVNLARRVEAVLQICAARAGKLHFLILDDSEHLSSDTRRALEEGLAAAGFQTVFAVVTDDPVLNIEVKQ